MRSLNSSTTDAGGRNNKGFFFFIEVLELDSSELLELQVEISSLLTERSLPVFFSLFLNNLMAYRKLPMKKKDNKIINTLGLSGKQ